MVKPADCGRFAAGHELAAGEGRHGEPGADGIHRSAVWKDLQLKFSAIREQRDVKDGRDEDLNQEPEMVRAFRDTWELGVHSYLTYLRERLLLARELLAETGSIFVQISD